MSDTAKNPRLEFAQRLFREYYAACFWFMNRDLVVTEEMIPSILKGLRIHGGHRGMIAAHVLQDGCVAPDVVVIRFPSSDSKFRFFPMNSVGGELSLHPADGAIDRVFEMMTQPKVATCLEIMMSHRDYLGLGALCWAACARDPGLTPWFILEFLNRRMKFRHSDLVDEGLAGSICLQTLKKTWLGIVEQAHQLIARLPLNEAGCLYLNAAGSPVTPDPASPEFATLIRHYGSLRGAWPVVKS